MTQVIKDTDERSWEYDRSRTGWEDRPKQKSTTVLDDGTVITSTYTPENRIRPAEDRQRCGVYTAPGDAPDDLSWGDHRVTLPGTTCEETNCHVNHHPDILPGCAEPSEDFYDREGVRTIAGSLWGWDCAGMISPLGDLSAWNIAHVVLDSLRDAGYEIVKKND